VAVRTIVVLGRAARIAGVVAIGCVGTCDRGEPDRDALCVVWSPAIHPLLVGDTVRLRAVHVRGSDCPPDGPAIRDLSWHTSDSAVVDVSAGGVVRGRAPGNFRVEATGDGRITHTSGYVLPPGWRLRLGADSIAVQVGDTVQVRVWAESEGGARLPAVPFEVATPEFLAWARDVVPDSRAGRRTPDWDERGGLFDRPFFEGGPGRETAGFVARRAGSSWLTARIGDRTADVRVVVR
jgi:hypothetical protein